jgi:uncharacterized membrane protein
MTSGTGLSEKSFETWIGRLLRVGVILAAAVVLTGGVLHLVKYGIEQPMYRIYSGEPAELRYVSNIFHDAVTLHSRGIIQLGLLILIATPVARVAFSVVAFATEKDWLYVTITLIVLGVLIYSLSSA